jgi:hypothetical protein
MELHGVALVSHDLIIPDLHEKVIPHDPLVTKDRLVLAI